MTTFQHRTETIRGELTAWRHVRQGWGFGELEPVGASGADRLLDAIRFTGTLVNARVGDTLELTGSFVTDPKYGRQFKAKSAVAVRAEGSDGAIKWMSSRFPGIGDTRARELKEAFGDTLWHVIEHEPERLAQIKGITLERARAISETYKSVAGERDSMVTLRGWGLTDGQIAHCVERWESLERVVAELRRNPFLLSQEVHGFGFKRADEVGRLMGIRKDAPERIKAGVEHTLEEAMTKGHVYVPGKALQRMTSELLGVSEELVGPAIRAVAESGRIVRRGWRVYTRRMDYAEEQCASGLRRLLARSEGSEAA